MYCSGFVLRIYQKSGRFIWIDEINYVAQGIAIEGIVNEASRGLSLLWYYSYTTAPAVSEYTDDVPAFVKVANSYI